MNNITEIGKITKRVAGSTTASEIISPEENWGGVAIKTLYLQASHTGGDAYIFAAKKTPSVGSNERIVLMTSGTHSVVGLPHPIRLPPGFGLYIITTSTTGGALVTYDLED
ncbi:MAG TPA: hypothetical protein VEY95_04135 [Azospirillaceae bacterium]|nr:hypothetical protein [Azospirillaceae bacterium]